MENSKDLLEFVRGALGCQCPDEAFDHIECRGLHGPGNLCLHGMTIGKRLLIYIWKTNDLSLVRIHLPAMLLRGKNERDRRGLNRFRLVIAADHVEAMKPLAQELFKDWSDKDDKVHLHVVHTDRVPEESFLATGEDP